MSLYLKHLAVKTIMAFLFGIGGLCIIFYSIMLTDAGDDKTPIIAGMFIGYPVGACIGIYITRKFLIKSTLNNIRYLIIPLVFTYIGIGGIILSIFIIQIDNNAIELLYLFIVVVLALLGDLLTTKLSGKSIQTH